MFQDNPSLPALDYLSAAQYFNGRQIHCRHRDSVGIYLISSFSLYLKLSFRFLVSRGESEENPLKYIAFY